MLEFFDDLGWAAGRALRRVLRGPAALFGALGAWVTGIPAAFSRFWFGRSLSFRRRTALVLLVLAAYALIRFVSVPGVPCSISTAKDCPPADHAASLVPADAYAYVHVNLDSGSNQFRQAADLADRIPKLAPNFENLVLHGVFFGSLDVAADLQPWLGDEAAFASLPAAGGRPLPLFVLAVRDRAGAERFARLVAKGTPHRSIYRGVTLKAYGGGLASAETAGFLLLGPNAAVKAAIDVDAGGEPSLSSSSEADGVRDPLPSDRIADAYVSQAGIQRLLAGRPGLASQLDTFTDYSASTGIAAAVVAHGDGVEVQVHSSLDPAKAKANPGFFAAFPSFSPSLATELPADTLAYVGFADPAQTIKLLLSEADAAAPGLSAAFARFNADLRHSSAGVDLAHQVLPALGGETGLAVAPAGPNPYVTLLFRNVNEDRARALVARLEAPVVSALRPAQTGQAPTFSTKSVNGVSVHSVRLTPVLDLSYAIDSGTLVVSTNPAGVKAAIEGGNDLAGQDVYSAAVPGSSGGVSALVFLNLEGLVRFAQPRGLSSIRQYANFKSDIAKLRSLGLTVKSGSDSLDTDLFVDIE